MYVDPDIGRNLLIWLRLHETAELYEISILSEALAMILHAGTPTNVAQHDQKYSFGLWNVARTHFRLEMRFY